MNGIFDEIKMLVYQKVGETNIPINRETRLYKDLRIDGDDAFELLQSYMTKFNVDMTGFNYNEYFAPEGIDIIGAVLNLFRSNKTKLKELTLGDLERAAKAGRWIE